MQNCWVLFTLACDTKFRIKFTTAPPPPFFFLLRIQLNPRRTWGLILLAPVCGEGCSFIQLSLTNLVGLEHKEEEVSNFGFSVD